MKKKSVINNLIIIIYILLLFFLSNCLKISIFTQPKILGIFIFTTFLFLSINKSISLKFDNKSKFKNNFSIGLLALTIFVAISSIINKQYQATYLFEIIRPLVYMISMWVFVSLFAKERQVTFFNKILYFTILFFLIINIIQFYDIASLNELYVRIIAPTQYVTLVNGYAYPRVIGLMSNPNVYGYVLSLFNLYLFYLLLKKRDNKKSIIWLVTLILLNRFSIYLTGSRTAIIVTVFSELLFIFLYILFNKKNKFIKTFIKSCTICLGILLVEIAVLFVLPLKYTWRVKSIFYNDISSWEIRKTKSDTVINEFLINQNNIKNIKKSIGGKHNNEGEEQQIITYENNNRILNILFGTGSQKDGFNFDNEFIQIFVSYGIFGILSFIAIFVLSLLTLKKYSIIFRIFYISILSLNSLYMISAGSFFSYNLFISLILFITLVFMGEYNEKN